ncbi:MAG: hypothetical protein ACKVOU_01520 [Cytophagales bacterium]
MQKRTIVLTFTANNILTTKHLRSMLVAIGLICLFSESYGQDITTDDNGGIENTEIVIEKNKKIVFPEMPRKFEKVLVQPRKINTDPKEYAYKELPAAVAELETKIKISTIKDEQNVGKKINYLKAGLGNYWTTYLEGQLLLKANPKYQAGLHIRHFGSILGPVQNSLTSANTLEAHGTYFFEKSILSASATYNRQVVNYYGYDHGIKNSNDNQFKDSIYQVYQQFAFKTQFTQVDTLTKFIYQSHFNYFSFSNRYKNAENEVDAGGKFAYEIDKSSKVKLQTNLSVSNYTDSISSLARVLFNFKPEYERKLLDDKLVLRGGFNIAYENDTNTNARKLHLYPALNAEYQLLTKLYVFAGVDGGIDKNMYRSFVQENPFLGLNPKLLHTNKQYELYTGLSGNIINTLHFRTSLSLSQIQNLSLYVNSVKDNSKFEIYYDNASLLKFKAEISYQPTQRFQLGLKGAYFQYKTATFQHAWHRPSIDISTYASYNLFSKIWFTGEIYYLGGIKAVDYKTSSEINLNDIVDINITANYKINDRFSVFMYFYNILSQNYQRYNLYQAKGITVMGGLTYTF